MLHGRVLLLNQNMEVLGTIGVARAIRMTLRKENPVIIAEIIADRYLTSAGGQRFDIPSVLILKHFIDVRKHREENGGKKRMKVYLRDRYTCQYCSIKVGKKYKDPKTGKTRTFEVKDLTWDHINPRSKGGSNEPSNLATCCGPCNTRKADRTPEEANMPLRTEIHDIKHIGVDNLMLCQYVEHRPEWFPYLEGKHGFVETYEQYKSMAA